MALAAALVVELDVATVLVVVTEALAVLTEAIELDVELAVAVAVAALMTYLARKVLVELDLSMRDLMSPTISQPESVWSIVPTGCLLKIL